MKNQNLSEDQMEEIRLINKQINELYHRVKNNFEDLLKELEHRISLGEDIIKMNKELIEIKDDILNLTSQLKL